MFRRTKQAPNQSIQSQGESDAGKFANVINLFLNFADPGNQNEVRQTSFRFEENMSSLNLNSNTDAMALDTVDFSTIDFGKFEDIGKLEESFKLDYHFRRQ